MEPYQILEREFAKFIKFPPENVVACSSGTAALHLALESLNIPRHSHIVLPDYAMIACARACTLAGVNPVFVDCKDDLTIDPKEVKKLWKGKVVRSSSIFGIMAVHTYGRSCDMDALADIADRRTVYLIEDQAESHGLPVHPRTDAACWSFYKNKIIAGEEGGMVAFRQKGFAGKARMLRCLGFTAAHDYSHVPRGHNYRLANCLAERIRASLYVYDLRAQYRWDSWNALEDALNPPNRGLRLPAAPWVYWLRVEGRDEKIRRLREVGVPVRYGFKPISSQEEYRGGGKKPHLRNPKSYAAGREVLYLQLPMTRGQIQDAISILSKNEKAPAAD